MAFISSLSLPSTVLTSSFTSSICLGRYSRNHHAPRSWYTVASATTSTLNPPTSSSSSPAADSEPDITQTLVQSMRILHKTDQWVAVSKPAGILVHRSRLFHPRRNETFLISAVRRALKSAEMPHPNLFPVQRLDRPTTGVILFALNDSRNAAILQDALQSSTTCKQYWVIANAASQMPQDTWENDHPLKDLDKNRKNRKQRPALTKFKRLASFDEGGEVDVAVLEATLSTGRRHQIRRHLSNSRFPVLGDTSHGDTTRNHFMQEKYGVERLCLHARRLSFKDPFSQEQINLQVPVPDDLRKVVQRFPGYSPTLDSVLDLADPLESD